MSDKVLEAFIQSYIQYQPTPEVEFVWQGGEPTLMGLDFYRRAIRLQEKYGRNKRIKNALQTNGTLLDDEWCRFLTKKNFLVGLSLDGPEDIHNRYRIDSNNTPTFNNVLKALNLLRKHGTEFNVLTCVTKESAKKPLDVYRFLKEHGVRFVQFIPVVERTPDTTSKRLGLKLSSPPLIDRDECSGTVTPWSVDPSDYGNFLISIFDEWVKKDVGSVFIMNFEWALAAWLGLSPSTCTFTSQCGRCVVIEHNGDVFSCDHYVYPQYRLGNIVNDSLAKMIDSSIQHDFGASKELLLPQECRECEVLFACRGECPKRRFISTSQATSHLNNNTSADIPGKLNYLCKGYKSFFRHINGHMKLMARLLERGIPVSRVMEVKNGMLLVKLDKK